MEKKIYDDNFEQFLREATHEFRMYPSKRVWNSLYNDLHPGRRWPSLAVCLLLICSILFIGISHNDEVLRPANSTKSILFPGFFAYQPVSEEKTISSSSILQNFPDLKPKDNIVDVAGIHIQDKPGKTVLRKRPENTKGLIHFFSPSNSEKHPILLISEAERNSKVDPNILYPKKALNGEAAENVTAINNEEEKNNFHQDILNDKFFPKSAEKIISEEKNLTPEKKSLALIKSKNAEDKEWIEDYAFHNQPRGKNKSGLSYEIYFTPSVGYRSLSANTVNYQIGARPSQNINPQTIPVLHKSLDHHPALNLEAGYTILNPYTKSIRFKGGVQLNYTNYIVNAYDLGHSNLTTLLLNDPNSAGTELSQRSSNLGNLTGSESERKLKNNTFQVSIPVGADVKLIGKHNLQWFAGVTLQPTYVVFGNAYLVSSDLKYYVYDDDLLRRWNLNAGVETFISYKTKNGMSFTAGPQFRYQLFSTYDREFSYTEKLYNLGVKLGITRNF